MHIQGGPKVTYNGICLRFSLLDSRLGLIFLANILGMRCNRLRKLRMLKRRD